ncbi:TPA: hypothetical protein JEL83_002896 [Salmonella enterica subsp. enterica serovar Elisabethville]|nr:hypothetical protein [Salmonella enterica subsp. enterica serovar Elisabethville]
MSKRNYNDFVIVYSLSWPETCAVEGLSTLTSTDTRIVVCFSPEELAELLSAYPTAAVILGMLPHENVYLLFSLAPHLQHRRILFLGQKFNYVDLTVPFYFFACDINFHEWKDKTIIETLSVLSNFLVTRTCNCSSTPEQPAASSADELLSNVNGYLLQMLSHHGVEKSTGRVLHMLSCGLSPEDVARLLGISAKTVSVHKYKGMSRLKMKTSSYNIYCGLLVKANLQKRCNFV